MNDRQESLAWGLAIGGLVIWWLCRRRGLLIGSAGGAGSSCGCGSSGHSTVNVKNCPPKGQTSYLYQNGYSQAPIASQSGPYLASTVQPVIAQPAAPLVTWGGWAKGDWYGYPSGKLAVV